MKLLYTLIILLAFFISCSTEPEDSETVEDSNNICAFEIEKGGYRGRHYKCYSNLSETECTYILESENDSIINNLFYYGNEIDCIDKCEELIIDEVDTCEITF